MFISRKKDFKNEVNKCLGAITVSDSIMDIIQKVYNLANETYSDLFKKDSIFSWGLAQKWVNMTLKYWWLFETCPIPIKELHAPIDRYIIHAITGGNSGGRNKYGFKIAVEGFSSKTKWSCLDKEMYEKNPDFA